MKSGELVIVSLLASCAGAAPGQRSSKSPPPPPLAPPAPIALNGPAPEVASPPATLALPAVPSFDLPPGEPGVHHPRELRVAGRRLLGTEIQVKGYVTWIYSCAKAIAKPGQTPAQVQRRIDQDPTLCERAKFYLGSTRDTPPEHALWVVDVPRPPYKLEKERLPREQLAAWPAVPRLAVGDHVLVSGKFELASPHAERNSDGLLVYGSLEHVAPSPPPALPSPGARRPRPEVPVAPFPRRAVSSTDPAAQRSSIRYANAGNAAYRQKQYAQAIQEYEEAIKLWPDNHVAYYGLGGAHAASKAWAQARDALAVAAQIAPDQAMYHLVHGWTQYEVAIRTAREDQARHAGSKPEEITPDLTSVDFDAALASLARALNLRKDLWRAHYLIGRIYRDRGEALWAAEELDAALRSGPREPGPWIALAELYRRWDYDDQAIELMLQATAIVPPAEATDLWYELGLVYDDKRRDTEAVAALSRALDIPGDRRKATFQRGLAYFRLGDFAKAKLDLEAFLASPEANDHFARDQANRMLTEIAARKR